MEEMKCGAPFNWKTLCRIVKKSSILHHSWELFTSKCRFFKKITGPIILFITAHYTLTYVKPRPCSIASWGFSLFHTGTVPYTHQKKKICWSRSRPLQCEITFLFRSVCTLSFGPIEAYKHAILVSCEKCHTQFSEADLILNLLSEQTCECSSEIFRVNAFEIPWFTNW
jgi:hypothetical protein